jgi:CRP-like cAMP-binding protein
MQVPSQRYVRNRLLAAMPASDYEALKAEFEPVALTRGDILVEPDQAFTHVVFPEVGVVSAVSKGDGRRIEIGLVGCDGFVGVPLALGVDRSPHESIVQIEGEALRLPSATFSELLEKHPPIRTVLLRYAHLFQLQTAQTALSNGSYSLEERLARWLLMCDDRFDGDEFPITHEFLAFMLGVRRPGVTTTVHILEGAGMIRARRSRIQILDRAKLEAAAGESYGGAEAEYRRLIGPGAGS